MRSSSINWIMAAMAITDMISQLVPLCWGLAQIFIFFYPCYSKKTAYMLLFLQNLITAFDSFSRRCTTWLSLSMAFIRTLVIRNPLKLQYDNLTKPKAAFWVVVVVGTACLPLGIMNYFWREIIEEEGVEECTGNGTSGYEYYTDTSAWFADNDMLVYNIYYYLEGVFFKLIPSILFPIVTIFLIIEIRKNDKSSRKALNSRSQKDSGKMTKLIFYLSLTFFFGEFPMAILYILNPILDRYSNNPGFYYAANNVHSIFFLVLRITSAIHFLLCFLMSSQYRTTATSIILCGYTPKQNIVQPVQAAGSTSAVFSRNASPAVTRTQF
ncbi:unnamed protein product [Caenorhabditis nigoni]